MSLVFTTCRLCTIAYRPPSHSIDWAKILAMALDTRLVDKRANPAVS
ncbi:hypothetical protein [Pseudomonas violetae]|uniref:Uncharacterized protein n=1 Tax=Pseudomonas violetae TaxID=2915813 RepID=A0ABT0EZ34_9PSED|nr:hypothetical protein [Pseudomonas violetae]MCK1791023.1 hypothetical protein [Pseudomonas violetae]